MLLDDVSDRSGRDDDQCRLGDLVDQLGSVVLVERVVVVDVDVDDVVHLELHDSTLLISRSSFAWNGTFVGVCLTRNMTSFSVIMKPLACVAHRTSPVSRSTNMSSNI